MYLDTAVSCCACACSCFENMSCFEMPHIGLDVVEDPDFDGSIAAMRKPFLFMVRNFVEQLFNVKLEAKTVNGRQVGGQCGVPSQFSEYCWFAWIPIAVAVAAVVVGVGAGVGVVVIVTAVVDVDAASTLLPSSVTFRTPSITSFTSNQITASALMHFVESHTKVFADSGNFPVAVDLLTATSEANNRSAREQALTAFKDIVDAVAGPGVGVGVGVGADMCGCGHVWARLCGCGCGCGLYASMWVWA
jgi:hypothetical protein